MERYRLVSKGIFESTDKFEKRLNALSLEGWKAISISHNGGHMVVLMEKPN